MGTVKLNFHHSVFGRGPQHIAKCALKILLGTACLVGGCVLVITLWLIPLGLPIALVGVALLMTAGESTSYGPDEKRRSKRLRS